MHKIQNKLDAKYRLTPSNTSGFGGSITVCSIVFFFGGIVVTETRLVGTGFDLCLARYHVQGQRPKMDAHMLHVL